MSHVQPALQHDDRRRRTLHPLGGRQRRLLAGRHTGQGRAAADPPCAAAQGCRALIPKVSGWVAAHSQISFYLWLVSLTVIIGRTTTFILDHPEADGAVETALAATALVICLVQFRFGRWLGRRYGDAVAGGQSLGQKNTVLAVWMAQSFLDPISSVAPTAYIVWQNFVNSYQIYKKDRETTKNKI